MSQRVETVDLSPALRIKSLLNWIRNLGLVLGSLLLVLAVGQPITTCLESASP